MTQKSNYKSSLVAVTTATEAVLPLNKNRTSLILFNTGAEDVKVWFETNTTMFFLVEAGKGVHFIGAAPINAINCTVGTGTSSLTVLEA